jgi:hypothetical protein
MPLRRKSDSQAHRLLDVIAGPGGSQDGDAREQLVFLERKIGLFYWDSDVLMEQRRRWQVK